METNAVKTHITTKESYDQFRDEGAIHNQFRDEGAIQPISRRRSDTLPFSRYTSIKLKSPPYIPPYQNPMFSYDQYNIRCKTCNEPIAQLANTFLSYVDSGMTQEDALNEMRITEPCSRSEFQCPTKIYFNMENRDVIEGMLKVEVVSPFDISTVSRSQYSFASCMPTTDKGIALVAPSIDQQGFRESDKDLLGGGIPLDIPQQTKFIYPTVPGTPTINESDFGVRSKVYVGANRSIQVLNGRTYIAR